MRIIFLGAPGTGKGTYAQRITDNYGIPQVSTGDIFRESIAQKTILGLKVEHYVKNGLLVPDDIAIDVARKRLFESDCMNGFILDGFPRTISQAKALEGFSKVDAVLQFVADEAVILKRLSGRRVCRDCNTIYNMNNIPPKKEGICDKCGGEVYQRPDETEAIIRDRLKIYNETFSPVIGFYKDKGLLIEVDANKNIHEPGFHVIDDVLTILDNVENTKHSAKNTGHNGQIDVKHFIDERGWETPGRIKDLLLNIVEETGEAWNIVKWVDAETQARMIIENKDKFSDFIGDQMFLIMRIANIAGVDASKALQETIAEYEQRFPKDKVKGKHTNLHAGGIDYKYQREE